MTRNKNRAGAINFFLKLSFNRRSKPNAHKADSVNPKIKMTLEGCIDDTNGKFRRYGIFEIGF